MTIWYPDTCDCICHVENQELLIRCNAHTTYAETLTANQTINSQFGPLEIPSDFEPLKFDFESDRDAARRLNRQDVIDILDKFDTMQAERIVANAASTISDLEKRRRTALREYLAKPLEERKRTQGEPTRTQLETEVDR